MGEGHVAHCTRDGDGSDARYWCWTSHAWPGHLTATQFYDSLLNDTVDPAAPLFDRGTHQVERRATSSPILGSSNGPHRAQQQHAANRGALSGSDGQSRSSGCGALCRPMQERKVIRSQHTAFSNETLDKVDSSAIRALGEVRHRQACICLLP